MTDRFTLLIGETRARLLRLVRRKARSVSGLSAALGITDNAVRTHVAALERDGLVRRAGRSRSSGGKPARLYELTPAAEELFPKAYAPVLRELVVALRAAEGEAVAASRLRDVGRRLGGGGSRRGSAGDGAESGAERVAAAASLLESIGGSVRVTRTGEGWRINGDGCPLSGVVVDCPELCALAETLVAEATGMTVHEDCDRSDDRPRCSFHVLPEGGR